MPIAIPLMIADTISYLQGTFGPQWGIFQSGTPVVIADNVVSFDYRQDWILANYPIEQGAFATYDKVQLPFNVRIRMSAGGAPESRQLLIGSLGAIAGTLGLFDAVTRDAVYLNCNVMHFDYHRDNQNGAGMIIADVWLNQIAFANSQNQGGTAANPSQPSGAGQNNGGTVQPVTSPIQITST